MLTHKGAGTHEVGSASVTGWPPLYLVLEAKGLRSLPLATRRRVAQAVERDPGIDAMPVSDGGVILIQFKTARQEVQAGLRRLAESKRMVHSDREIMNGTPVYRGTR